MTLPEAKNLLIAEAWQKSHMVHIIGTGATFMDNSNFTIFKGELLFWYEDAIFSSRVTKCPLPQEDIVCN